MDFENNDDDEDEVLVLNYDTSLIKGNKEIISNSNKQQQRRNNGRRLVWFVSFILVAVIIVIVPTIKNNKNYMNNNITGTNKSMINKSYNNKFFDKYTTTISSSNNYTSSSSSSDNIPNNNNNNNLEKTIDDDSSNIDYKTTATTTNLRTAEKEDDTGTNNNHGTIATTRSDNQEEIIIIPVLPDDELVEHAYEFLFTRKQVYMNQNLEYSTWKLRGIGYLYNIHNIILLGILPKDPVHINTQQSIIIHQVNKNITFTECDKLTLWVRVNGPEIFAGIAKAVNITTNSSSCYWTYDFNIQIPGSYEVDIKILIWNGYAPITGTTQSQCTYTKGTVPETLLDEYKHDGFQGFKMYSPIQMCCEVCARTPHCLYWSIPFQRMTETSHTMNGCELYFNNSVPEDIIPKSNLWPKSKRNNSNRLLNAVEEYYGPVHTNPTSYYCGCGWSFWFTLDFPCLSGDLDDRVITIQKNFTAIIINNTNSDNNNDNTVTVDDDNGKNNLTTISSDVNNLPICTLKHEQLGKISAGRWVRETVPDYCSSTSYETVQPKDKNFPITKFDNIYPHCWHIEDITKIGNTCVEMNCRFINKESIWRSSIHNETNFFSIWRPYKCNYYEYTTEQLQQCITTRKISAFIMKGTSVAQYMNEFIQYRLSNITLYDTNNNDPESSISIVFDTLGLLHKNGPDGELEQYFNTLQPAPSNEEHYAFTGFFLSSEREVHTHVSRMDKYNQLLPELFASKNYKMINAFDLTAAFTYDVATQMDGMHFIGPSMKMIVTKLFHHVCSDYVVGSIV